MGAAQLGGSQLVGASAIDIGRRQRASAAGGSCLGPLGGRHVAASTLGAGLQVLIFSIFFSLFRAIQY